MVVTVVRGHAQQVTQTFELGEAAPPLSVGSRGEWQVSGPGVMPHHLWLTFDGQVLFAASGDAAAYLRGRPLSNEYSPVEDGAELRFGFALLRVSEAKPRAARVERGSDDGRRRRLLGMAGAALLLVAVVGASLFALLRKPSDPAATAPSASASPLVAEATVPAPMAPPAAAPEAAPPSSPLAALDDKSRALLPPPEAGQALGLAVQASRPAGLENANAPSPLLKPPAAFPQNVANRPVPRVGESPWVISAEWRAQHERQLHALARTTTKLVFLGDSITEGWSVAPAYRARFGTYSPINLGIANDTTQNVLWRLEHGALDGTQPKVVVLLIGINNLAGGFTAAQTADGVRAIVASIQAHAPTARVLVLGVLPARREATNPLRQAIKDTNRLLSGLASPGRVEFHDLGSCLLEADGSIAKTTLRDFVHPTPDGFERITTALAPHLDAILKPATE